MTTSSAELAEKIILRLVEEGLLSQVEATKLRPKLAEGSIKPEDWKLSVELSASTGVGEE